MISRAIVQSAIVLMNRRIKAEREVIDVRAGLLKVTGMHLHHSQGTKQAQAQISEYESSNALF